METKQPTYVKVKLSDYYDASGSWPIVKPPIKSVTQFYIKEANGYTPASYVIQGPIEKWLTYVYIDKKYLNKIDKLKYTTKLGGIFYA